MELTGTDSGTLGSPRYCHFIFSYVDRSVRAGDPTDSSGNWSRCWEDECKAGVDWDAHGLDFQGLGEETKQNKGDFQDEAAAPKTAAEGPGSQPRLPQSSPRRV